MAGKIVKKKHLFVDNGRPHGTVVLNWHGTSERDFTEFAEAFHVVAKESVATLRKKPQFGLDGNPSEDFLAYPIVFLYRHALELYMKAVLLVGAPMLSIKGQQEVNRQTLLKTHSLDILAGELERIFEVYGWEWDFDTPHFHTLENFRAVIAEFQGVDARSDAFRYPFDTKGSVLLGPYFRFNIFELCDVLDELFPVLEGATICAFEELHPDGLSG